MNAVFYKFSTGSLVEQAAKKVEQHQKQQIDYNWSCLLAGVG